MKINNSTLSKGFLLAGLMNMTVIVHSRFFTNATITKFDPVVMSNFGLLMIVVWGLAYMSIAKKYQDLKWLVGVFAIEKLIYGCVWLNWIMNITIKDVYKEDIMAGLFYSMYGINDWLFFGFFSYVFIQLIKVKNVKGL